MTQCMRSDEPETNRLVSYVSDGTSWLRHRGLAGRLDWALLHGAAAEELKDIRLSWEQHIDHLRREHHLLVSEDPTGFFRIIGASAPPEAMAVHATDHSSETGDGDDGEGDGFIVDPEAPLPYDLVPTRIRHTARALFALHTAGELAHGMHKAAVCMLIRQASECNHWHNSAHYRSRDAGRRISEFNPSTPSQYQAFCRENLRHEHMVPNIVIYRMLVSRPQLTVEWIEELLSRFSKRATITREEDRLLLTSAMPAGFNVPGHEWFEDPLARYKQANLSNSLELRTGDRWFAGA